MKMERDPDSLLKSFLKNSNSKNLFTDGSKISNNVHMGAVCIVPKCDIELHKSIYGNASFYTAE